MTRPTRFPVSLSHLTEEEKVFQSRNDEIQEFNERLDSDPHLRWRAVKDKLLWSTQGAYLSAIRNTVAVNDSEEPFEREAA